jgi:hypothetical protein
MKTDRIDFVWLGLTEKKIVVEEADASKVLDCVG